MPIRRARRRLSVVSDNALIEGIASKREEEEDSLEQAFRGLVVSQYAGFSKKGFAPYNRLKKNQDSLVMAEHRETNSLLLGALDGHGEHGEKVSGYFKNVLPTAIFGDQDFSTDPNASMTRAILESERTLLSGCPRFG